MIVNIKPLSVNEAWQGKRFKTKKYLSYEQTLLLTLPKKILIPEGKLALMIVFGLSNKNSDVDNGVKPIIDILQKAYGFNDKRIYLLRVAKDDVLKGEEYISIVFNKYNTESEPEPELAKCDYCPNAAVTEAINLINVEDCTKPGLKLKICDLCYSVHNSKLTIVNND